jgi:hypothetical protein
MSALSKRARDVAANLRGKLKLGEDDISSDSVVMIATLLESCGEEIESPKQQLDAAKKQNVLLREALQHNLNAPGEPDAVDDGFAALDATQDLSGYILCDAEPVGEVEQIDIDEDAQPSAWLRLYADIELGKLLYKARNRNEPAK